MRARQRAAKATFMAEDAIPSDADPTRPRTLPTRLPSLAQLYAAQRLGYPLQAKSYTLPELYALERTGAPLDLVPSLGSIPPQQSQAMAQQPDQALPTLVDQGGAPLQPEPLTPGERIGGAVRAAGQSATGGLSNYLEALARTGVGVAPKSTQALREADEAFRNSKVGKVPSQGAATVDDNLADIHAASQRFGNAYPAEATASWLAGLGATSLLARALTGQPLVGELAGRAAPELASPSLRRLGLELPEQIAPEKRPYNVAFQTWLLEKPEGTGRARHIREANENYLRAIENDPGLALWMSKLGIKLERTPRGKVPWKPPEGWTWHHHPHEEGLMQLMPRWQHESPWFQGALHPFKYGAGGYARWGHKYVHIPGAAMGGTWLMQHPQAEPESNAQQQDDIYEVWTVRQ
jgi:hypothetical protein